MLMLNQLVIDVKIVFQNQRIINAGNIKLNNDKATSSITVYSTCVFWAT